MSLTRASKEKDTLIISLKGRADSTNAAELEQEIWEELKKENPGQVILDIEELEYISSAGLRVILRLRKERPELRIINASTEVYEIFDMTGFTDMMEVEKAYRRVSVEGCEVIGQGAKGKVYRIDPETIIKVYLNPDSLPGIKRERELARKAFVHGVPTAISYDVVRVGTGYGSVFELLNADSVSDLLAAHPENLEAYAALYVDLLKKIHGTKLQPGEVPDRKEAAKEWAKAAGAFLSVEKAQKLSGMVEAIPDVPRMLHGDYHANNVLVQNGEALLIDMDTICMGHPVLEFATMYMSYIGFGESDHSIVETFFGLPYDLAVRFWKTALRLYFSGPDHPDPGSEELEAIENKAKVLCYTRLVWRTAGRIREGKEEERTLLELYRSRLDAALDETDTLDFPVQ